MCVAFPLQLISYIATMVEERRAVKGSEGLGSSVLSISLCCWSVHRATHSRQSQSTECVCVCAKAEESEREQPARENKATILWCRETTLEASEDADKYTLEREIYILMRVNAFRICIGLLAHVARRDHVLFFCIWEFHKNFCWLREKLRRIFCYN